jgi:hypothetical protein
VGPDLVYEVFQGLPAQLTRSGEKSMSSLYDAQGMVPAYGMAYVRLAVAGKRHAGELTFSFPSMSTPDTPMTSSGDPLSSFTAPASPPVAPSSASPASDFAGTWTSR